MTPASPISPHARGSIEPAAAVLPYVKNETRSDIAILHDGDITRVLAPCMPWWQLLMTGQAVAAAFCAMHAIDVFTLLALNPAPLSTTWGFIVSGTVATLLATAFSVHLASKYWRRRIFEVTPTEVRVGYIRRNRPAWEDRWRRRAVGEVKVNPFDGRLLIRITGKDLKDYIISNDRYATEIAARTLQEALTPPVASGREPNVNDAC